MADKTLMGKLKQAKDVEEFEAILRRETEPERLLLPQTESTASCAGARCSSV